MQGMPVGLVPSQHIGGMFPQCEGFGSSVLIHAFIYREVETYSRRYRDYEQITNYQSPAAEYYC